MSKFWTVVTIALAIGLGFALTDSGQQKINFTDLETECRYDRASSHDIHLNQDDSLSFEGYFPVENPETEMDYRYRQSGDSVVLNVKTKGRDRALTDFEDNCKASGVYKAKTSELSPGQYMVTLKHDGEQVEQFLLEVR